MKNLTYQLFVEFKIIRYIKTILLCLFIFVSEANVCAKDFTGITDQNVLYDMAIYEYYIWCGTSSGLVRWNTIDMTYIKYTTADGLPYNNVHSVEIDSNGFVYAGTFKEYLYSRPREGGGLTKVDPNSGTCTSYDLPDNNPIISIAIGPDDVIWAVSHSSNTIPSVVYRIENDIYETFSQGKRLVATDSNGDLWCHAKDGGLLHYTNGTWKLYSMEDGLAYAHFYALAVSADDVVWAGTMNGLSRYDGETWRTFTWQDGLPQNAVDTITFDAEGDVWVSNSNGGGIARYNGETWTVYTIDDGLLSDEIYDIVIDSDGIVWAGSWGGLSRFDGTEWTTYKTEASLLNNNISSIAIGLNNAIWFGTLSGLSCYYDGGWINYTSTEGLPFDSVSHVAVSPDGTIWTVGGGVACFDGESWILYTQENELITNRITSIAVDSENTVWISQAYHDRIDVEGERVLIQYGGISRFDGESWITYTDTNGLPHRCVTSVAIDSNDDIWASTFDGVAHFDGETWTIYTADDIGGGWDRKEIYNLAVGPNDEVWIASGMDLACFDGLTWRTYLQSETDIHDWISIIAFDYDGFVWLSSYDAGIYQFNGERLISFTTEDRESLGSVYSIAVCPEGVLFGTDRGIYRYGDAPSIFKLIVAEDGTIVEEEKSIPSELIIIGNYPNPFNSNTTITYFIPKLSHLTLDVYNISSQKIATLYNGAVRAGTHSVVFDCSNLSSGIYFYRFRSTGYEKTGKMLLLK